MFFFCGSKSTSCLLAAIMFLSRNLLNPGSKANRIIYFLPQLAEFLRFPKINSFRHDQPTGTVSALSRLCYTIVLYFHRLKTEKSIWYDCLFKFEKTPHPLG